MFGWTKGGLGVPLRDGLGFEGLGFRVEGPGLGLGEGLKGVVGFRV